ncbi:MAG TPA: hypothetical protein VN698_12380 [Bacteroidia bacterium]|nr:hypothetical protein [Bacteroidia bacterium]
MDNQPNVDILRDAAGDDLIRDGDFAIGDGTLDDCLIIFKLNKGALKSDPILGPELQKMINSKMSPTQIKQILLLNLKRDNKTPKTLNVVNGNIKLEM